MKQQDTELDGEPNCVREHRARIKALFQAERAKIERFLEYRLRSRAEAQELAQEAYARLVGLHDREVTDWAAYLWRTVRNLANTRQKQLKRHEGPELLTPDVLADDRTPETACAEEQAKAAVLRAIDNLPERQRTVATLHRKGRTTVQIARALGISERMCQRDLARAIVEIRRMIGLEKANERR